MPLQSRKSGYTIMFLEKAHSVQKPNKRLRKAFRVIYFVVSLAKKVIANGKITQFLPSLCQYGGVKEVAAILETDMKVGITTKESDIKQRINVFGSNTYEKPPTESFLNFVFEAFKDTTIIILLVCAVFSLGFGIKQHSPTEGWYDGGSIIVAAILVVVVSAISNFRQSRQFDKLSDESSDLMKVEVVRNGHKQPISIFEVVVGDIACLKIGDQVSTDGLFLDGDSLKVDESSMKSYIGKTKANDVINAVVRIVAAAVTIIVVAIPKGLPLAVTLTLAYSMKRMMVENSMVRKLSACETMGSAITICIDKTSTLTLNQMKVTEFCLGKEVMTDKASLKIAPNVLEMLHEGVGLNTTDKVYKQLSTSIPEISGSPTELAILSWVMFDLAMDIDELKQGHEILHVEAFNSEKKRSGVLTRINGKKIHVHWKGAAEMILSMCSNYYTKNGNIIPMNDEERTQFEMIIKDMSAKSLRCTAFGYRKCRGHVVAVTGDGTNNAPALKEADIGLSMGIQGTKVAKESSDIVILDDNFTSVVTVLKWRRCVYKNIQKFIQFQLTVNVAALVVNFVSAISSGEVPLTAVQLLWVNLIMDTLGALALATEQPINDLMTK
ncbi:hypothetical protein ACSBR1_005237 [Camellia fascicularis]